MSQKNRILIIDEMHPSIIPLLEKEGFEVDYRPEIKRGEILEIIATYSGLIIRSKTPMDKELLEKASDLKFIGRAGAGLDQIDLSYLEERNIKLFNAPEGNRDAVGEHAIGGLLALFNHINKADQEVRNGIWDREGNRGEELAGKTVGVFGFGNMGQAFARKLLGFDVKLLAYDKYKKGFGSAFVKECSFEKIQQEADILSIHVPLTVETRNYFTLDLLKSFSKPIYLINTARGEVISFETLNLALDQGILRGAVLDVLENEKFKNFSAVQKGEFDNLAARPNVLFSPHIAGWTFQSYEKINQVLVEKIRVDI
ncbi:phosphoglycerate dehydrogenase-like oxidoreductase [Belliella baltica DSM 15883]|uniref:Phosphoglycerate dehydrogenase-like oxidoreductase n=1 Tax=Belliella baltica (strain DSM 15883 / CIP 108006 / LMG 21964 / BA134) TaxID=866536 RepID=I3Z9F7_BELBD|nr:2-hydroxyacid dehydrogenase [Belliella baltica]AFL85875.1 phosphoglycerate dehydrogenase-like oxidoreductase [Belliella baltica DSM 15883]